MGSEMCIRDSTYTTCISGTQHAYRKTAKRTLQQLARCKLQIAFVQNAHCCTEKMHTATYKTAKSNYAKIIIPQHACLYLYHSIAVCNTWHAHNTAQSKDSHRRRPSPDPRCSGCRTTFPLAARGRCATACAATSGSRRIEPMEYACCSEARPPAASPTSEQTKTNKAKSKQKQAYKTHARKINERKQDTYKTPRRLE